MKWKKEHHVPHLAKTIAGGAASGAVIKAPSEESLASGQTQVMQGLNEDDDDDDGDDDEDDDELKQ